jgi:hypothetical protein
MLAMLHACIHRLHAMLFNVHVVTHVVRFVVRCVVRFVVRYVVRFVASVKGHNLEAECKLQGHQLGTTGLETAITTPFIAFPVDTSRPKVKLMTDLENQ